MSQQANQIAGEQPQTLRRELKARHLAMIAIGGSIGTGLLSLPVPLLPRPVPAGRC